MVTKILKGLAGQKEKECFWRNKKGEGVIPGGHKISKTLRQVSMCLHLLLSCFKLCQLLAVPAVGTHIAQVCCLCTGFLNLKLTPFCHCSTRDSLVCWEPKSRKLFLFLTFACPSVPPTGKINIVWEFIPRSAG